MPVKSLQPSNTPSPILVTPFGSIMLVKPLQPSNAKSPILVTLSGIVMLVKPLQFQNAYLSTLVTLSGIVMLVKPLQSINAHPPILVTFFPSISPGITSSVLSPVYPVMVISSPFSTYENPSYVFSSSACAVIPTPPHSSTHRTIPNPA